MLIDHTQKLEYHKRMLPLIRFLYHISTCGVDPDFKDVHGTSVEFFEFINSGVVTEDNFDELAFQYNTLMDVQCTSITMAYMCSRDVPESTFKFTCKPELVQFSIEEYKNIIVLLDSVLERLHSWVV